MLGGPVTDAFSQLVLAMRAKGHGETTTADAGAGGPGEITSYSSFANPTPWSTFDKMHAGEVKNCLGDVRRTLKAYAAHAAPAGALNERLMGAVGAAWLETRASAEADDSLPGATGKERAFVWGGGEKFATLLNDTCVHRVLFRDEPTAAGNRLVADTLMTLQDLATARVPPLGGRRERGARRVRGHRRARRRLGPRGRGVRPARQGVDAPFGRRHAGGQTGGAAAGRAHRVPQREEPRRRAFRPGRVPVRPRRAVLRARRGAGPQGGRLGLRLRVHELRQPIGVLQVRGRGGYDFRGARASTAPRGRDRTVRPSAADRSKRRRARRAAAAAAAGTAAEAEGGGGGAREAGAAARAGSTAPPAGTGGTGAARRAAAGTDAEAEAGVEAGAEAGAAAESAAEDVATTLAAAAAAAAGTTARTMGSGRIDVLTY